MPKNLLISLILLGYAWNAVAADVLFSVGDTKVDKSEFEYIYKKNNFSNKADYSRKSLEDYLSLYINFRLKVKEAIAQGLDNNDHFKEELGSYEKQLLDSYVDKAVLEKLVKQEYDRSLTDVNISHIFFPAAMNGDIADAMTQVKKAEAEIKSGKSFEEAAKSSQDSKTADKGGKLGWFNSYQISLPEIEEAVYAMKPGEISAPIKTRLGYHLVKLNETRPARPKLKAAIIKRFFPISDTTANGRKLAEDTIQLAYAKLKSGMDFEKAVGLYSEDEATRGNKGELDWFGINQYAKVFEETVYGLKDGEYSQPFKTSTAWYIVKRLETSKPVSLDESSGILKMRLQNLPQYQFALDKFVEKLNDKLMVKNFPENYPILKSRMMKFAETAPFTYRDTLAPRLLLQINDQKYNENDYGKQIQETFYTVFPKPGMDKYDALIKSASQKFILDYYKNDIRKNDPEYNALMDEYRNGIMIFSLSEKYIWNKASEDSAGLQAYYDQHKADFILKKRATVRTIIADNLKDANVIAKFLASNKQMGDDALSTKMKSLGIANPKITAQVQEVGKATADISTESISKPVAEAGKYKIVQVYNLQPEKARTFEERRGYVVAAYQDFLEKKWLDELRLKYPVTVNQPVFDGMVRQ